LIILTREFRPLPGLKELICDRGRVDNKPGSGYAKDYIGKNILYNEWHSKNDGASIIARMLFEEATDINFYVGKAINPATRIQSSHRI